MKKHLLALALVVLAMASAVAQRAITGKVTDQNGEVLIGASILAKGSTSGTVTDVDGTYSLSVPAGISTVVVSYTGFKTRELELGTSNVIDVSLDEALEELSEVVVTGLGIKKEKKALGYAVTTLGSAQIELKPEADIGRILRGKVPGVDINATSGLAGSGTNIVIRGYKSISGTNQPLFVVDGVPFNSETNSDRGFDTGGATASSRFLDLDPNNIAEVSVLKGLSATVLYGEAGRNGVILVTTKTGGGAPKNKKMEITLDQSFHFNEIASNPEFQNAYGNGFQNLASAAFSNWGAPFDPIYYGRNGLRDDGTVAHPYDRTSAIPGFSTTWNEAFPEFKGVRYPYIAYEAPTGFFKRGQSKLTSLNVASNLGKGTSLSAAYSYLADEGFVPNNNLDKHNFSLGLNTKLANGLTLRSTFNFITSDRNSPPSGISFNSGPTGSSLFSELFYTPRSIDVLNLPFEDPINKASVYYRGDNGIQNPFWTLKNSNDNEVVRRFFGTINLGYDITDWLRIGYRLGLDTYGQTQRYAINKNGRQIPDGLLTTSNRLNYITDQLLSVSFNKDLGSNFSIDGLVGFNLRRDTRQSTFTSSTQQFVLGLLTHQNFINHNNSSSRSEENQLGALATFSLSYKDYLYLNMQARNDWTSTLEKENRSVVYPSASLSFIASEALPGITKGGFVNYLKLRLGYGTSAGYPNPYNTRSILSTSTRVFQTLGGAILNTNSVDNQFGNPNLKPEIHQELEFGVEAKFLKNRLGVDLSLYDKLSKDLIIGLQLDPSTGYNNTTINAASVSNKGIELGVNYRIISGKNLNWEISANYTRNLNFVESLYPGIDQIAFAGFSNLGNFAIPGQPYGVIQTDRVLRDDNGNAIINGQGFYQAASTIGITGNPNPDYLANAGTTITFKGLSFNMLWSYVKGGDIYSSTASTLYARGLLEDTGFDRFVPVIVEGVKADGTPNDIQITSTTHFWQNSGVFISENKIFDGTYLKLREVSLSYDLPKKWLEKSPFGQIQFSLSGQNLWFRAFNFPRSANFDPEVLSLGVGNGRGFEYLNVPTSKKYGASLRVTF